MVAILIILGVIGLLIGFVVFMAYAIPYGFDNKYPEELYDPINFPKRSEESSEDSSEDEPNVQWSKHTCLLSRYPIIMVHNVRLPYWYAYYNAITYSAMGSDISESEIIFGMVWQGI